MKTEQYYVWVLPESRKVLVEDRGGIPLGCSEHKEFPTWEQARDYGHARAKELGYEVEYDNDAGRYYDAVNELN